MKAKKDNAKQASRLSTNMVSASPAAATSIATAAAPSLDPSIPAKYFAAWKSPAQAAVELNVDTSELSLIYEPNVFASAKVRFYDAKRSIDMIKDLSLLSSAPDDFGRARWGDGISIANWDKVLQAQSDHPDQVDVSFENVPDSINSGKEIKQLEKEFSNWVYQSQKLETLEHPGLKITQASNESKEAFLMRIEQMAKEERDEELDKLQEKYAVKLDRIEEKIRKEEQDVESAEADLSERKTAQWLGVAETVFSVFVKGRSRSLSGVSSKNRMRKKASQKLEDSIEDLEELNQDFESLQNELESKLNEIRDAWDHAADEIITKEISPRKTDIKVNTVLLAWHPFWVNRNGQRVSAR